MKQWDQMLDYVRNEAEIIQEAVRRVFCEEWKQERAEGKAEGRKEHAQEVYERMRAANIPEEQACASAFGWLQAGEPERSLHLNVLHR